MIRFRCTEDEQRYNELRTQIYVRLATSGMPSRVVSEVLRNFGKLEALLQLEGIRQGVAAEALYAMSLEIEQPVCPPAKAYQLHSAVYGSSDTPLHTVELEWLKRLGGAETELAESALDPKPMRFAPTTLTEAVADGRVAPRIYQEEDILAGEQAPRRPAAPPKPRIADAEIEELLADNSGDEPWTSSPELLDRVRSQLQESLASGWRPTDWKSLILGLHTSLRMDAFFLDMQLASPMGRAVLDQCGLMDVRPNAAVSLSDFEEPVGVPASGVDVTGGRAGVSEPEA